MRFRPFLATLGAATDWADKRSAVLFAELGNALHIIVKPFNIFRRALNGHNFLLFGQCWAGADEGSFGMERAVAMQRAASCMGLTVTERCPTISLLLNLFLR